jgi:hypothetical protein
MAEKNQDFELWVGDHGVKVRIPIKTTLDLTGYTGEVSFIKTSGVASGTANLVKDADVMSDEDGWSLSTTFASSDTIDLSPDNYYFVARVVQGGNQPITVTTGHMRLWPTIKRPAP